MAEKRWKMLGPLARGDQRAAQGKFSGGLYLFDYSGPDPDKTDDGPLRFDQRRPIEVGLKNISVPVYCERDISEKSVFVSPAGLLTLVRLLQDPPESVQRWYFDSFELRFSAEALTFLEIGRLGVRISKNERQRVATNIRDVFVVD